MSYKERPLRHGIWWGDMAWAAYFNEYLGCLVLIAAVGVVLYLFLTGHWPQTQPTHNDCNPTCPK